MDLKERESLRNTFETQRPDIPSIRQMINETDDDLGVRGYKISKYNGYT